MKVWLTCFVVLFGAAEVLQWGKQFSLPFPVFLLAGAFLAVASNYDKLTHLPFHLDYEKLEGEKLEGLQGESSAVQTSVLPPVNQTVSALRNSDLRSDRTSQPLSFIIRKP